MLDIVVTQWYLFEDFSLKLSKLDASNLVPVRYSYLSSLQARLTFVFLICSLTSCVSEPEPQGIVQFTALEASSTEVWLRVKFESSDQFRTFRIDRGSALTFGGTIASEETVIVDKYLQPSSQYTYTFSRTTNLGQEANTASISTMDTTSHNWLVSVDTLNASGFLYDVMILSQDDIWAVGALYVRDSNGVIDPRPCNAVHWNGIEWTILRLVYYHLGQPSYGPLYSVYAFNENDIWFGAGNMIHWDGLNFVSVQVPQGIWGPYRMNRIWGTENGGFYVAGDDGALACRENTGQWRRLTTGTSLRMVDVLGKKKKTGEYEILSVSDSWNNSAGSEVFAVEGNEAHPIWNDGRSSGLDAIWFVPNRKYIAVGSSVWTAYSLGSTWTIDDQIPLIHTTSIDGNGLNDYMICGAIGYLAHNNGVTWKTLMSDASGAFVCVRMKGDFFVTIGTINGKTIIVKGTR